MNTAPEIHVSDCRTLINEVRSTYKSHLAERGIKDPVVICNNSGGKDSGAVDLLAMEILGGNYRSVAADTGNEHPLTIEHLQALHMQRGGDPVEIISADYPQQLFDVRRETVIRDWAKCQRVMAGAYRGIIMPSLTRTDTKFAEAWRKAAKALGWGDYAAPIEAFMDAFHRTGNPFLDMALLHGGFPLGRQRFCTQELKLDVVFNKVLQPLLDDGEDVIQWSGVRADESEKRAGYDRFAEDKRDPGSSLFNFLPIHQWKAADVFALYRYFGIQPNPLYTHGMERVGCMPCILVHKEELAEIAARFPDEIERVAQWEQQVAKVSRWIHWMIVGHVDRRQFKPVTWKVLAPPYLDEKTGETITEETRSASCKLGVNARLPSRIYIPTVEAYQGTCMLGPRGNTIGGSVHDAVDWSRTGRGGKVYDLVTASINAEVCSSRYGLCE